MSHFLHYEKPYILYYDTFTREVDLQVHISLVQIFDSLAEALEYVRVQLVHEPAKTFVRYAIRQGRPVRLHNRRHKRLPRGARLRLTGIRMELLTPVR